MDNAYGGGRCWLVGGVRWSSGRLGGAAAGVGGSPWLGWSGQGSGCQLPSTSRPTANALRNSFQPRPNTLQIRGGVGVLIPAAPFLCPSL